MRKVMERPLPLFRPLPLGQGALFGVATGAGLGEPSGRRETMRRSVAVFLLTGVLLLGGCIEPTGLRAVIDSTHKPSQGVIWLQDYPAEVTFDASRSTGEIISYRWTVLDEEGEELASSTEEEFTYQFDYGRYLVRLEVTGFGLETDEAQVEVVANKPPVAVISYARKDAMAGEEITFRADDSHDPDGSIVEYLWDFGDGSRETTEEPEVTHTYEEEDLPPGESRWQFTVTLVVIDDLGGISEPPYRHEIWIYGGCCGH
ncbi:TPA: hypothetical protein DCL37_06140 [Candidatus Acetothermia bacterium]|nr:hypothetical protein [Candidatus Acetothermia bacterium]